MAVVGVLEIQMAADLARLSKDMERARKTVGSTVSTINNVLGTIGAGISFAFFVDLKKRSDEFEKSLARISTQIDGTERDLKRLEVAAKGFASQFGTRQIDQANAFYEIISAGIEDTAKATEILNTANKLAIGGITTLGVSVDGLTNIMNSYAGKIESANSVSDALFIGMKAGKATMEELSTGLGKVTPLSSALGVSFDELVAVIATLSKQGIQTQEAITGVRGVLSAVAKPTSQAAELAESLGLQFNAAALQAKGFARFIENVIDKTGGSTTALSTLFGRVEALVPVMALAGSAGDDFNNIMQQMEDKAGSTQEAFEKMAASPGFKVDQLMSAISNAAITLGAKLSDVLTPAIVKVTAAFNNLFLEKAPKKPFERQIELINSLQSELANELNKKNIPLIGDLIFDKRQVDLLRQRIADGIDDLAKLSPEFESIAKAADIASDALTEETEVTKKLTKEKQKLTVEMLRQQEATERTIELDKKIKEVTASVATEQEKYNDAVRELEGLKPFLSAEVYSRALKKLEDDLNKIPKKTRETTDEVTQLWTQAGRNIQSTLADSIFNFFRDGLGGMVKNVGLAVGRIASEFASLKIAQSVGLAGLFGVSGAASASTGGGFDVTSLLSSGFGITNAIGGGISALGGATGIGSLTAFGQAFGGDAIAAFAGGAGSLGATLGSFAGPAAIAGVADIALRQLFGNKKLGGTAGDVLSYIPVVGTLINGLFGRGPEKLRRQAIEGTATGQGFEGSFDTIFKAKGGLFRSDKIRRESFDPFGQFQGLLDESIQGFSGSIRGIADNLGLATSPLDNFNQQISILSEKGKELTKEQISQGIADIGEVMAREVLPNFREFASFGESASQVLTRINSEFNTLNNALQIFGKTSEQSAEILKRLTIEERSNIVARFGGIENISAELNDFYSNVFTDSQKLEFTKKRILDVLKPLNIDFVPTIDQIYKAVTSGNPKFVEAGFLIDGLVVEFNRLNESVNGAQSAVSKVRDLTGVNDAFSALQRSVQAERNKLTEEYNIALRENNDEIQNITQSLGKLNSLSAALQQTIETINPVGLNAARSNISSAIASARSGNVIDLQSVRGSLQALTSTDTSNFGSRVDFLRSQAQNAGLVNEFSSVVDRQLRSAEDSLDQLEIANTLLTEGFNAEQSRLESIISEAQNQVNLLSGISDVLLSIKDALAGFNSAVVNAGGSPITSTGGSFFPEIANIPAQGPSQISDRTIKDFLSVSRTPEEIARAAVENNVSSARIKQVLGLSQDEVDRFFRDNPNIPKFATGTSFVPRTGPAIVHKGERIINTEQNKDLVDTLKELLTEMRQMKEHSRKTAQILDDVSAGGGAFLTEAA